MTTAVGEASTVQPTALDVDALRAEFPILAGTSRGKPLVYLDSAATTQKPQAVLGALADFYSSGNANIHRGVYELSERATVAYDGARARVAKFIGASNDSEVVFVRGTTEAINLVARSFPAITSGCTVLVSEMEHHANIVPWQLAGARTVPIPVTDSGELDMAAARAVAEPAAGDARGGSCVQRARHRQSDRRALPDGACRRRASPG